MSGPDADELLVTDLELVDRQRLTLELTVDPFVDTDLVLDRPVGLAAGRYLVALAVEVADPSVLTIPISGQQSGTETRGGVQQDQISPCRYQPSEDLHPAGRAYVRSGALPWTGTADNYLGLGDRYRTHRAKVSNCIGVGPDIFNPGNLDLSLLGS
jgi:hypothetical protein